VAAGTSTTRCPFLREAQVKSCAASGVRKMIVRLPAGAAPERCSSPGYDSCPSSKQYRSDVVVGSHCPFLQESLVQYCAAAPVVKYIPYTESVLSRCGSGQHASCELYAAIAGAGDGAGTQGEARSSPPVDGRRPAAVERFPGRLWYAANHMWLDAGPGFSWRIGVDSFFTGLFGTLDRIEFPARRGHRVPEVSFSSGGTAFTMAFPGAMMITEFNMYLLSNPSNLLADPYRSGWLFRGLDDGAGTPGERPAIAEGLIPGVEAGRWIDAEERRMTSFVHDLRNRGEGIVTMADGGRYQDKLFACLDADQRRELVETFFAPPAGREGRR
jgi:glycine cleavage system H lipoate-binding protein